MILTTSTLERAKEFGLTMSRLYGSNDLLTDYVPGDPSLVDVQGLTEDGKAFLALLVEERAAKD
jgi:hypothetical protein